MDDILRISFPLITGLVFYLMFLLREPKLTLLFGWLVVLIALIASALTAQELVRIIDSIDSVFWSFVLRAIGSTGLFVYFFSIVYGTLIDMPEEFLPQTVSSR